MLVGPKMAQSWDVAEVPVGDTSVVCFNYTLDGTLCEVCALPLPASELVIYVRRTMRKTGDARV